jgi:undecaprenyl-diphosphatase
VPAALLLLYAAVASTTVGEGLSYWEALVLGVVEGLTEYLPVSSTGHLMVATRILGIGQTDATKEAADSFVIAIQAGAILAVLVLYRHRVGRIVAGVAGRDAEGRRLSGNLAVSIAPALILALVLEDVIKDNLFGAGPVVVAWIVGGLGILAWTRWSAGRGTGVPIEALTARTALLIGLAQCIALWPGTSRSLVTIIAALLVGLSLPAAVEYSFLLGLVTLGAATAYELVFNGSTIVDTFGWGPVMVGFLAAFLAALVAVQWMVGYLQRRSLDVFGWYRIAAGVGTAVLIASGAI